MRVQKIMQFNPIPKRHSPQATVESPPRERDLWRSIDCYLAIRRELPNILPGAAWDICRCRHWPHWRLEEERCL
jgi:hypothetical protein